MKHTVVILCLVLKFTGYAQRPSTGAWFTANLPVKISSKWQMHNDAGYRTLGSAIAVSQYLYRTGFRYHINSLLSTSAGVAFFSSRTSFEKQNREFGSEFRTWQEIFHEKQISSRLQWQNRCRSEQRFFAGTETKERFTAHRFRLRSSMICKCMKKWSVNISEEYFRQFEKGDFSFDQNRAVATAIYHFSKSTQLQGGYMWLLWPQNSSQHILTFALYKTISYHGTGN